jgi:hypothetical protein
MVIECEINIKVSPYRGRFRGGFKRKAPDGQGLLLTNYKPIYEKDVLSEQSNQLSTLP